jgi:dihydrodipicolinate synthase/N-acetylneuraminate lyase
MRNVEIPLTQGVNWKGVIPAITTPFNADFTVDEGFLAKHSRWLVDEGSVGLVPIGSLGESATLNPAEKRKVIDRALETRPRLTADVASVLKGQEPGTETHQRVQDGRRLA